MNGRKRMALVAAGVLAMIGGSLVIRTLAATPRVLDPEAKKAEIEQRYESERQAALREGASDAVKVRPEAKSAETRPFVEGIHESSVSPFPPGRYSFTNNWLGRIGNSYVYVWAGALAGETAGVVVTQPMLEFEPGEYKWGELREFPVPASVGPVRILRADGTTITFGNRDGETLRFDAADPERGLF